MTVQSYINRSLDFAGNVGVTITSTVLSGNFLPSAVLGYTGGWLTGVGTQLGLFQGVASSVYYTTLQSRFVRYLEINTKDNDPNFISPRSGYFLYTVSACITVSLPIFLTMFYGNSVMNKLSNAFDQDSIVNRWVLGPSATTKDYNVYWGIGVSVLPALTQHFISYWRTEDKKARH